MAKRSDRGTSRPRDNRMSVLSFRSSCPRSIPADVGPVQIRAFGSLLLGQTLTGPALPHLAPESPTDAVHD